MNDTSFQAPTGPDTTKKALLFLAGGEFLKRTPVANDSCPGCADQANYLNLRARDNTTTFPGSGEGDSRKLKGQGLLWPVFMGPPGKNYFHIV